MSHVSVTHIMSILDDRTKDWNLDNLFSILLALNKQTVTESDALFSNYIIAVKYG